MAPCDNDGPRAVPALPNGPQVKRKIIRRRSEAAECSLQEVAKKGAAWTQRRHTWTSCETARWQKERDSTAALEVLRSSSFDLIDGKDWLLALRPLSATGSTASSVSSADYDSEGEDSTPIGGSEGKLRVPEARYVKKEPVQNLGTFTLVVLTVICGCICQAPYELMNSRDKGCAHLISVTEHIFGVVASLGALRSPRQLPWSIHISLAGANIGYTLLLNAALSTTLPTVVLITMKNGNLVANMFLGFVVMRQVYNRRQYAAVAFVSLGLMLSSLAGRRGADARAASESLSDANRSSLWGVIFLAGALLSRAASGLLQEHCGRRRGGSAPVPELLLYRCALGLPAILTQWPQIVHHARRWSYEPEVSGVLWPMMWVLLAANIFFDYAMKVAISHLIDRTSALTATLVLTFQRFVAFIVSATMLGDHRPDVDLWLGATFVMLGTLLYTMEPSNPKSKSD